MDRRTFRGHGGANDRRLPKQNARRRRNQAGGSATDQKKNVDNEDSTVGHPALIHQAEEEEKIETRTNDAEIDEEEEESDKKQNNNDAGPLLSSPSHTQLVQVPLPPPPCSRWNKELDHLMTRIHNIQSSIQFSASSIVKPITYRNNVLNPVANVTNEWRSIVRYHYHNHKKDSTNNDSASAERSLMETKTTSVAVFMLLQQALQCGPLAGSKPGYFKRCGSEIATVVHEFLNTSILVIYHDDRNRTDTDRTTTTSVDDDEHGTTKEERPQHLLSIIREELLFTNTQIETLIGWRKNARKAVHDEKPPSKSVLKQQQKQQHQSATVAKIKKKKALTKTKKVAAAAAAQ